MTTSRYEVNINRQPGLAAMVLAAPRPAWMKPPRGRKTWLVGVGTNHHAARIAAFLWRGAGLEAEAVHSFDFVTSPPRLRRGELALFLSHRGTKSYSLAAERLARRAGLETAALTGEGSPWTGPSRVIETGPMEDTGAFTQSFTATMAWLCRWPGKPSLLAPFRNLEKSLRWGPKFPDLRRAKDLVLLGDGPREWVAREVALKLQEAAYIPCRAFGLEEFLHGPRVSVDRGTLVLAFSSAKEPRWKAPRAYLKTIGVPLLEVPSEDWLAQVVWGQRLTLDACRRAGIDPDALKTDRPRFAAARKALEL